MKIERGEIYMADLGETIGSEQGGNRPVLIIQNDIGNRYSPTTIIAPLTKLDNAKPELPTHYLLDLQTASVLLSEQIRTIDKMRLKRFICKVDDEEMEAINNTLKISIGIDGKSPHDCDKQNCPEIQKLRRQNYECAKLLSESTKELQYNLEKELSKEEETNTSKRFLKVLEEYFNYKYNKN